MNEFQQRALAQREERMRRRAAKRVAKGLPPIYRPEEPSHLRMHRALAQRASSKGWEFDLTPEWCAAAIKMTHCEATGIKFVGAGNDPFGRTIDRMDSTKGYTIGNCWVVCWIYNRAKLDGSHEDVMTLARALCGIDSAEFRENTAKAEIDQPK